MHYLVDEGALSKAMQLLITSGFDLPIDADEQVTCQHFSEPVRMTTCDVAALYPVSDVEVKISDLEVEPRTVAVIISRLRHASAPGHTGLSPDMLRDACCSNCDIADSLARVFNGWMRYSQLPHSQNDSNVVPIPKKADREERAKPGEEVLNTSLSAMTAS